MKTKGNSKIISGTLKSTSAPAVFLFVIASLFVAFGTRANFDLAYLISFFNANVTVICLCLGEAVVILTGGIDISLGPLVSLCNVLMVVLIEGGLPIPVAIVVMLLASAAAGAFNGFMVSTMRIIPLLTTYATSIIFGGLALTVTRTPVYLKTTSSLSDFYRMRLFGVLPVTLVFILVPYLIWKLYKRTPAGIQLYSAGQNELSAYCSGVNVVRTKMFAYTFSGLTAGIGALAMTSMIQGGDPSVGASMSMTAISAVVIGGVSLSGGKGDIGGGVFGCLFLFMLSNIIVFYGVNTFWQELLRTLILLLSVVVSVIISRESEKTKKGLKQDGKSIGQA